MKENKKDYMVITVCPICKHINLTFVNAEDYWSWQEGELVQNAFPYLSANDREALISGICPKCWDEMVFADSMDYNDENESYGEEDWEQVLQNLQSWEQACDNKLKELRETETDVEEFDYDFADY